MKPIQRVIVIASGLFFLASTGSMLLYTFANSEQSTPSPSGETFNPVNDKLEQEALAYEKVLAKEPDNQFAMQELINTRLQMNDLPGLITQVNRLMELHPEEPQFQEVMTAIEADITANTQAETPTPESSTESE